jgi:hypothetical protein
VAAAGTILLEWADVGAPRVEEDGASLTRGAIELAQVVIAAAAITPASIGPQAFPSLGESIEPEVRGPFITQLLFAESVVRITPGRLVLQVGGRPDQSLTDDVTPITTAARQFIENYVGRLAEWQLAFIVQERYTIPDDHSPAEWLTRLVNADAIASIQGPLSLDVNLDVPFAFGPGTAVVRIEPSRIEPLNALFFLIQYTVDQASIEALELFATCIADASNLGDKIMALSPTGAPQ